MAILRWLAAAWLAIQLAVLVAACGGGGGASGTQGNTVKLAGVWTFEEETTTSSCPTLLGRTERYRATIAQAEAALTVITPLGTLTGTAGDGTASWTGEGTTSDGMLLRITSLAVEGDGTAFHGAYSWELRLAEGEPVACTGEAELDGARGAAPLPPAGLGAVAVAASSATLSWAAGSSDTDLYRLERAGAGCAAPWEVAGTTSALRLTVEGLAPGATSCFRVIARNGTGDSLPSAPVQVTPALSPPATPAPLTVSADGSTSLRLAWSHAGQALDGFRLARRAAGDAAWGAPAAVEARARSVVVSGLAPATRYLFRLTAHNAAGDSAPAEAEGTTRAAGSGLPAPGSAAAQAMGPSQVDVTWSYGSHGQSGFHVWRSARLIGTVGPASRAFVVGGLRQGVVYTFTVTAFDAQGDSPASAAASARTSAEVVGVTWDLTYRVTSSTCGLSTTLQYSDVVVTRSGAQVTVATGQGTLTGTLTGMSLSLTGHLGTAAAGLDVTSSSLTLADDGNSIAGTAAWSAAACRGTAALTMSRPVPPLVPPVAPSGLRASATGPASAHLAWTASASGAEAYRIYRAGPRGSFAAVGVAVAPTTAWDEAGLLPQTGYTYHVTAYNSDGESAATADVLLTTAALRPSVPRAPESLTGDGSAGTSVALRWVDRADDEAGFHVLRGPAGGARVQVAALGAGTPSWVDAGVARDTAYDYEVRAYNAAGESAGARVQVRTAPETAAAPAAPSDLAVAGVGPTWIRLRWTDRSDDEDRFVVYGKPAASFFPPSELVSVGAGATTATVEGLASGVAYRFQVHAAAGELLSPPSAQLTVTTPPAGALTAPTGLSARAAGADGATIDLAWTDTSSGEEGFRIYQAAGGCGAEFRPMATAAAGATSAALPGLQPATTYCHRVTAFAGAVESAFSAAASATTGGRPRTVVVTNDLSSRVDEVGTDWSELNQIGHVRIGPHRPEVVGAECASVYPSTALERLNPYDFLDLEHLDLARSIPPGQAAEFDLSDLGDTYCIFVQAAVWRYEPPLCCDLCSCDLLVDGWQLEPTWVLGCPAEGSVEPTYVEKWVFGAFQAIDDGEIRLSRILPAESYYGTSACQ